MVSEEPLTSGLQSSEIKKLDIHQQFHDWKKESTCQNCHITYENFHCLLNHSCMPFRCKSCSRAFLYDYMLKMHTCQNGRQPISKKSNDEVVYPCTACNAKFYDLKSLSLHQVCCIEIKKDSCTDCKNGLPLKGESEFYNKCHIIEGGDKNLPMNLKKMNKNIFTEVFKWKSTGNPTPVERFITDLSDNVSNNLDDLESSKLPNGRRRKSAINVSIKNVKSKKSSSSLNMNDKFKAKIKISNRGNARNNIKNLHNRVTNCIITSGSKTADNDLHNSESSELLTVPPRNILEDKVLEKCSKKNDLKIVRKGKNSKGDLTTFTASKRCKTKEITVNEGCAEVNGIESSCDTDSVMTDQSDCIPSDVNSCKSSGSCNMKSKRESVCNTPEKCSLNNSKIIKKLNNQNDCSMNDAKGKNSKGDLTSYTVSLRCKTKKLAVNGGYAEVNGIASSSETDSVMTDQSDYRYSDVSSCRMKHKTESINNISEECFLTRNSKMMRNNLNNQNVYSINDAKGKSSKGDLTPSAAGQRCKTRKVFVTEVSAQVNGIESSSETDSVMTDQSDCRSSDVSSYMSSGSRNVKRKRESTDNILEECSIKSNSKILKNLNNQNVHSINDTKQMFNRSILSTRDFQGDGRPGISKLPSSSSSSILHKNERKHSVKKALTLVNSSGNCKLIDKHSKINQLKTMPPAVSPLVYSKAFKKNGTIKPTKMFNLLEKNISVENPCLMENVLEREQMLPIVEITPPIIEISQSALNCIPDDIVPPVSSVYCSNGESENFQSPRKENNTCNKGVELITLDRVFSVLGSFCGAALRESSKRGDDFRCLKCNNHFESLKHFSIHYSSCKSPRSKRNTSFLMKDVKWVCLGCHFAANTTNELATHRLSCTKSTRGRNSDIDSCINSYSNTCQQCCSKCGYKAISSVMFNSHDCEKRLQILQNCKVSLKKLTKRDLSKANLAKYKCHICEAEFVRLLKFEQHVKRHAGRILDNPEYCYLDGRVHLKEEVRENVKRSEDSMTFKDVIKCWIEPISDASPNINSQGNISVDIDALFPELNKLIYQVFSPSESNMLGKIVGLSDPNLGSLLQNNPFASSVQSDIASLLKPSESNASHSSQSMDSILKGLTCGCLVKDGKLCKDCHDGHLTKHNDNPSSATQVSIANDNLITFVNQVPSTTATSSCDGSPVDTTNTTASGCSLISENSTAASDITGTTCSEHVQTPGNCVSDFACANLYDEACKQCRSNYSKYFLPSAKEVPTEEDFTTVKLIIAEEKKYLENSFEPDKFNKLLQDLVNLRSYLQTKCKCLQNSFCSAESVGSGQGCSMESDIIDAGSSLALDLSTNSVLLHNHQHLDSAEACNNESNNLGSSPVKDSPHHLNSAAVIADNCKSHSHSADVTNKSTKDGRLTVCNFPFNEVIEFFCSQNYCNGFVVLSNDVFDLCLNWYCSTTVDYTAYNDGRGSLNFVCGECFDSIHAFDLMRHIYTAHRLKFLNIWIA